MDYLYITLDKSSSVYAISLDEIFMTLYGFGKRKKFKYYRPATKASIGEIPGVVYRIKVTKDQHDKVRDILCDFLMDSRISKGKFYHKKNTFSSSEFVEYILNIIKIGNPSDKVSNISHLGDADVVYEGDLRKYTPVSADKANSILNRMEKNKEVVEHGTAKYEYMPNQV